MTCDVPAEPPVKQQRLSSRILCNGWVRPTSPLEAILELTRLTGKRLVGVLGLLLFAVGLLAACGDDEPLGRVFFIGIEDGDRVSSPVQVRMGVEDLTVEPANGIREGFGHHHILVDVGLTPAGQEIPKDIRHLHFGKAQTEAAIELEPGDHTLRLLFANGEHVPYDPTISEVITINVTE